MIFRVMVLHGSSTCSGLKAVKISVSKILKGKLVHYLFDAASFPDIKVALFNALL